MTLEIVYPIVKTLSIKDKELLISRLFNELDSNQSLKSISKEEQKRLDISCRLKQRLFPPN